jgi:hypothetical protein
VRLPEPLAAGTVWLEPSATGWSVRCQAYPKR